MKKSDMLLLFAITFIICFVVSGMFLDDIVLAFVFSIGAGIGNVIGRILIDKIRK